MNKNALVRFLFYCCIEIIKRIQQDPMKTLLITLVLLTSFVVAQSVSPVLDGIYAKKNGNVLLLYGYNNTSGSVQTIPIGSTNQFSPAPADRSQPTVFATGRSYATIPVEISSGTHVWKLTTKTSTGSFTATKSSHRIYFDIQWKDAQGNLVSNLSSVVPSNYRLVLSTGSLTVKFGYVAGVLTPVEASNNDLTKFYLSVVSGGSYTVSQENLPVSFVQKSGEGSFTSFIDESYGTANYNGSFNYFLHPVVNNSSAPAPEQKIWQTVNAGGLHSFIWTFDYNSSNTLYAGTWAEGKVIKSTNEGESWVEVEGNSPNTAWVWSVRFDANDNLYVGTSSNGVLKSVDGGKTFVQVTNGMDVTDVRALAINNSGHIFAGTWGGGIYRSTNAGGSWVKLQNGLKSTVYHGITVAPNGDVYAASYDGFGLYRSTDNGDTWVNLNMPYGYLWTVEVTTNGHIFAGTYGDGLYRSTDSGTTWEKTTVTSNHVWAIVPGSGNNVFVATWGNGVFKSENSGSTWSGYSVGLMNGDVRSLTLTPSGRLLASTQDGSLYSANGALVSVENNQLPTGFVLEQNYPNPFNPSTTIAFSIAEEGHVELSVYNLLGEQVAQLLNGVVSAGSHQVQFNPGSLPSGVYVYRLQHNGNTAIQKMNLLK